MHPRDLRHIHVAEVMGLTGLQLWHTSRTTSALYRPTRHQRSEKGKIREIDEPLPNWKPRFNALHKFIQKEFRPPAFVHGGVKKRSCFTSARSHRNRKYVLSRDVKNCFPSISTLELEKQLRNCGFVEYVASLLSRILTVHGRVPQGCPTSGDAQNFMFGGTDRVSQRLCVKRGMSYGRMCDDITLSGNSIGDLKFVAANLSVRLGKIGLTVNPEKLAEDGIQSRKKQQRVHNLVVSHPRGIAINRKHWEKATGQADKLVRGAKSVSAESLPAIAKRRRSIVGTRCYCQQADHGPTQHLRRMVKQADRHVMRALQRVGLNEAVKNWWTVREAGQIVQRWKAIARR